MWHIWSVSRVGQLWCSVSATNYPQKNEKYIYHLDSPYILIQCVWVDAEIEYKILDKKCRYRADVRKNKAWFKFHYTWAKNVKIA